MKIKMYLRESSEDCLVVSEMKERGRTKIYSKWGKRLQPIHYAALLLDPRGKHSPAIPHVDKIQERMSSRTCLNFSKTVQTPSHCKKTLNNQFLNFIKKQNNHMNRKQR